MRLSTLLLILCLLPLSSYSQPIHSEADDYLVQNVKSFQGNNLTLYEMVLKLCKQEKIRICIEEKKNFSGKSGKIIPAKRISVDYKSKTVMEILNDLRKKDSDYFWEYSRDGLINILPKSHTLETYDSSTLAWVMNGFKIQTSSIYFVFSQDFPYGIWFKEHGFTIDWAKTTTQTDIATRKLTMNLPPASGRDGLNSIVKSAGPSYLWHLYWKDRKPILEFLQAFQSR